MAVRQKTGILSWQIPLLVDSVSSEPLAYSKTSRTLCATKYYRYSAKDNQELIIVSISTASSENVVFNISVVEMTDFYLRYALCKYNCVNGREQSNDGKN